MTNFENPENGGEELKKPEAMNIDGEEMLLTPAEVEAIKRMRAENGDSWREQP